VHTAYSDGPGCFNVGSRARSIANCKEFADPGDSLVTRIDRTRGHIVGEPATAYADHIKDIRASDIDNLIEHLQDAMKVARASGVLPPWISFEERFRAKLRAQESGRNSPTA